MSDVMCPLEEKVIRYIQSGEHDFEMERHIESCEACTQTVLVSSWMKDFRRVSMKNGAAVVPLRDETCSGCNMKVRAQVVNEVLGGEIQHCHHCRRILYHAPNFDTTPAETEA